MLFYILIILSCLLCCRIFDSSDEKEVEKWKKIAEKNKDKIEKLKNF